MFVVLKKTFLPHMLIGLQKTNMVTKHVLLSNKKIKSTVLHQRVPELGRGQ